MPDLAQALQSLVSGVGIGLVYGLVGVGFCVIYNASGIVNFAQGVFVMLGGMLTHALLTRAGLPLIVAAVLATVAVAGVGIALNLLIVRPMLARGATLFAIILATLATQIAIERITLLTLGDDARTYGNFTGSAPLRLGPVVVDTQLFWILGCGALIAALLWLFFTHTRIGRGLRACSQNPEAAALLGIPVNRMMMLSFALSAGLGSAAGILITPTQYTSYNVGGPFGVNGFIAAIIGGFGSAPGALAGGVLLGAAQALAVVVFGAGYRNVAALTIMLAILLLFPNGIFNAKARR